jgi:trimeric autotransporter adhesin
MFIRRAVPFSLCLLASLLLTGCGSAPNTPHPTPVDNSRYSGSVHGGQQPVVGATIQLYTVGTTADGSAATPLLTSTVTSDSTGSFTITGLYSCTSATQVYIVATGGNPGLSTTNPNIALMAALGSCSALTPSTFININELTTVAAVAALAPYMSSATAIGASSTDFPSLFAAFTLANQLVDTTTGTSPGTSIPSGDTVPTAELNTLADILSACINSTGGTAGDGSLCGQLFSLTTISPSPAPTNTIAAMLNIANNPTLNTSALYALVPPTPPFQPTLTSAPANFQIQLSVPAGTPILQISPSTVSFPSTVVNTSSAESVLVTNTSSSAVTISSTSFSGVTGAAFAVASSTCSEIDPGGNCTISLTATPTQTGSGSGSLVITSSTSSSPQSVALSTNGLPQASSSPGTATLAPTSLTFNIWGTYQDATVTNTGSAPLSVSPGAGTTGGEESAHRYVIANNNCTTPVPAGSTCTYAVQNLLMMPISSYTGLPSGVTGQTFIEYTSTSGTTFQTTNILSTGSSFLLPNTTSLNVSPNGTVTFPTNQVGYAQTSSIELANIGTQIVNGQQGGLVITGSPSATFAISGANPGDFSVSAVTTSVSPNPASSCPGGTSACAITITFTPTAVGTRTAKVSINSGSSPTGEYISVTGTAIGPGPSFATNYPNGLALVSHLPSNIDPASIGNGTITVTNTGTTTLTLGATFAGPNPSRFTADVGQCRSVAPQATCSIPVTFSAPVGSYGATLELTDASSGTTVTTGISGTASYWTPNVFSSTSISGPPPVAIVFPTQAVNTTSAPQTFTVADQNQYPIGDPITVSLQTNSNFILPQGSTCPTGNQPCTLSIEFAPHTTGSIMESLTLADPVTGVTTTVLIYGTSQ